ncbi:hypothetical protein ACFX2I_026030 [Malus domestica]
MSLVQGKWIKENWCANFWVFVYNPALIHCSSRHAGRGSMRVEIDLVVSIRRLFFKGCFRFIKISSGIHYITVNYVSLFNCCRLSSSQKKKKKKKIVAD